MIDPAPIGFRRMALDDLPLLHQWLQVPQVLEWWWGGVAPTYEAVAEKYGPYVGGGTATRAYLILYADDPIGYIQTYLIRDYPEYAAAVGADEEVAGMDLLIGETAYLHKGLGSHILRRFLREVVFATEDIVSCIIGPSEANAIAIRAYEKAGFRYFKTIPSTDEPTPEYLMHIARDEFVDRE
jgi:RimJ/RimL family protein N-acetyltransferase